MPVASLATPNGAILCSGATLDLVATGGVGYIWSKDGVVIDTTIQTGLVKTTLNTSTLSAVAPGVYSVKVINASGCVSTNDVPVSVTMLSKPTVNFDYNSYCINIPILFNNLTNANASGTTTYKWTDNLGNTSSLASPLVMYTTAGQVSMKLVATSTYCPSVKDSITRVITIDAPQAATRLATVDAVIGDETKLQARVFPNISYTWSPAEMLSNATVVSPIAKVPAEQEFKILMTALSGCKTTDTILVRAFSDFTVFVPNMFSPNGDGLNDKLTANFIGLKEFKLFRVYNRAGQKVFESANAGDGWDGNTNGNPQPIDTYMWVVEGISKYGTPIRKTGLVTLLR
jgi:gliding motility-associated-like protein